MANCELCKERLIDYVFGLLEGAELDKMRAHVACCPACQVELARAQADSKLMARAAKAINAVPEFALPGAAPAETPVSMPATLPMPAPTRAKPAWRRPWVGWTAAAAVLIAVGASLSYYRLESDTLQASLKKARDEQRAVEIGFAALPAKYSTKQTSAVEDLRARAKAAPYLHIVGPTHIQPNAKAQLHITALTAEAEPAQTPLRVQLVDAQAGNIVQVMRTECDRFGRASVELDARSVKANSTLNVIVATEANANRAAVQGSIRVQAPSYVTRIDTNKAIYQVNDVLFFRVLVLDRYSLLPPTQPILVRVALKNPKDEVVASLDHATSEGGIVAKELLIAPSFLAGAYTLTVDPLDASQTPVQSAQQRLEVVRDVRVPDVLLDQDRYLPGDVVSGVVRGGPKPDSATFRFGNDKPMPVTIEPESQALARLPSIGGQPAPKSAKKGVAKIPIATAQRFHAPMPKEVPAGARFLPFTLELETGKLKTEYRGVVPLESADYDIDFFPEGGDLVAGVPNRVYYRLRSRTGDPVTGDGSVILLAGQEVIDSPYRLGLGYIDFTPDAREKYSVRITSPLKTSEVAQPFAKFPIRPSGVVLHVPTAVGRQGDPIRLTLRNQGPARKLLLVAQCRGQIVDQTWADVKAGSQDFMLQPTQDARGMVKVTAYEVSSDLRKADKGENVLTPITERLVYRSAVQRLELDLDLNVHQPQPGKSVLAKLTARTEQGDPASAWFLAAVVDERFTSRSRSLSAHFMLLNEIHTGSELEDAQVILHDAPESAQMLERFLGTHGWRRFIPARLPGPETPVVFSRENVPLENLQKEFDAAVLAALTPMRTAAFLEEAELRDRRTQSSAAVMLALTNLHRFEERVQLAIRLSLGILLATLLVTSLILMGIGSYRIIRQHKQATPAFGGAFACLALYIGIWFAGNSLGSMNTLPDRAQVAADAAPWQVKDDLDKKLALAPAVRIRETPPPSGTFVRETPETTAQQAVVVPKPIQLIEPGHFNGMAMSDPLSRAVGTRAAADTAVAEQKDDAALKFFRDRAGMTLKADAQGAKKNEKDTQPILPSIPKGKTEVAPPAAPNPGPQADSKKADQTIEYGYRHVPGLHADMLLWNPSLWLANGVGEFRFDIATGQATYRILLLGHTPTGRFGFHESRLDVLPVGR